MFQANKIKSKLIADHRLTLSAASEGKVTVDNCSKI
jgi:hypothetical protein